MPQGKIAILISGIMRSGASAIAGVIEKSGYSIGKTLRPADITTNPRGFFENASIKKFNSEIIRTSGLTFASPFISSEVIFESVDFKEQKLKLKQVIVNEFEEAPHILIKDPQLSFLLPLYKEALTELGYKIKTIAVLRNPASVATSIYDAHRIRKVRSYLLYLQYYSQLESYSRDMDRVLVSFEDLIDNPPKFISTLIENLGLKKIENQDEILSSFLDTAKFEGKDENLEVENVPDSTMRIYELLSNMTPKGQDNKTNQKKLNKVTSELMEWNSIALQSIQGKFSPEGESPFFIQLFIDSGEGMTEEKSLKQVIIGHEAKVEFDLENIENIQALRLDPINDYCVMKIHVIELEFNKGEKKSITYSGNFIKEHRPLLIFNVADPNINLTLPEADGLIKKLTIKLEYIAICETSVQVYLQKIEENLRLRAELDKVAVKAAQYQSALDLPESFSADEILQENFTLKSTVADLTDQLVKFEKDDTGQDIHSVKAELYKYKALSENLKAEVSSIKQELSLSKHQESAARKEIDSVKAELDKKSEDISSLNQLKMSQEGQLFALKEHQDKLLNLAKGSEEVIDKYTAQKDEAIAKQKELQEALNDTSYRLAERTGELNLIRNRVTQLESERGNSEHLVNEKLRQIKELEEVIYHKQVHINNIEGFLRQKDATLSQIASTAVNNTESLKTIQSYTQGLKNSLSYKLGFGLTAPARLLINAVTGASNQGDQQVNTILDSQVQDLHIPDIPVEIEAVDPINNDQSTEAKSNGLVTLEDQFKKDLVRGSVQPTKPVVLFISPHLPDFDTSSGGRRATLMLQLMAEEFDVYVYTLGDKQKKYIDKLKSVGVTVVKGPHLSEIDIDNHQYPEVKLQLPRVDAIIYAWYTTYFQSKYLMQLYPKATIIFDSVDVHWIREERLLGIDENLTRDGINQNKLNEVHAYNQGKIIWAVTEEDKQSIIEEIPSADVRVVSNVHDIAVTKYVDNKKHNILFFGGFKHTPNISAAKKLCEEILPAIRKEVPKATVVLAGSHAPDEIRKLGDLPGVDFRGFIEDEDLNALYDDCTITIVPLLAGAGIKGKICEAIAHKLPIVTNSIGNEGIELENEVNGLVTDDYDEMAELAIKALKREYDFDLFTERAQQKLLSLVGPDEVKSQMVESVAPMVSVCIVTWNRLSLMERCIESIQRNTKYPRYRVLAYSNGCTDGTQEYLKEVAKEDPRIIPMLSDKNEVFVIPNNNMMMAFPEDDVVLVNNDTYLNEGWLEELQKTAYCRKNTGIVGSKILYPDGTLQEFGSELYQNYSGNNIGKHQNPQNPAYQSIKEVGYVSGCSMYITRHTLDQVGVFDMQFHPCYCEDSDLSYSAWEQGIETVVTPYSTIYHDEGGTSGTSTESGFKAFQDVNFHKFYLKHRGKINRINWGLDQITTDKIEEELRTQFRSQDGRLILNGTQLDFTYSTKHQSNKIRSYREYKKYTHKMNSIYNKRFIIEKNLVGEHAGEFQYQAYNFIEDKVTPYSISDNREHIHRGIGMPNLRDELYCGQTKTNSRLRALLLQMDAELGDKKQSTVLYNGVNDGVSDYISQRDDIKLTNYEWVDDKQSTKKCTYTNPCQMEFKDATFDMIVETEQLHLIPDHIDSLKESARILKPGGKMLITVPFLTSQKKTQERSIVTEEGERIDLMNPIMFKHTSHRLDKVCYRLYGWSLIDDLREAGFSDAYGAFSWSLYHGILGMDILTIVAQK